jgi:hypothetical protein
VTCSWVSKDGLVKEVEIIASALAIARHKKMEGRMHEREDVADRCRSTAVSGV